MSYYTTIFPVDDFDINTPDEEIAEKLQTLTEKYEKAWSAIVALCATSDPNKGKDILYATNTFNSYWDEYIETYTEAIKWLELRNMKTFEEEVCIAYNHYPYNRDPESGVEEYTERIKSIKNSLVILANGNPGDLFKGEANGLFMSLEEELRDSKSLLEGYMYDLEFSKLCVKYYDTKEEG